MNCSDGLEDRYHDASKSEDFLVEKLAKEPQAAGKTKSQHWEETALQISALALSDKGMPHFYKAFHQILQSLVGADNCLIAVMDASCNSLDIPFFQTITEARVPNRVPVADLAETYLDQILKTGIAFHRSEASTQSAKSIGEWWQDVEQPNDWLGVPLLCNQRVNGVLAIWTTENQTISTIESETLQKIGPYLAMAMAVKFNHWDSERALGARQREIETLNWELEKEIRERHEGEKNRQFLLKVSELASTAPAATSFWKQISQLIGQVVALDYYGLFLMEEKKLSTTEISFVDPVSDDFLKQKAVVKKLPDVLETYRNSQPQPTMIHLDVPGPSPETCQVVPLALFPLREGGSFLGGLLVGGSSIDGGHDARAIDLLAFISQHLAMALSRIKTEDQLRLTHLELEARVRTRTAELSLANEVLEREINERNRMERRLVHEVLHDSLTGLPNRNLFMDRLNQAFAKYGKKGQPSFAVLFLDLDRFKVINDSMGHLLGDHLLKVVSRRIATCTRLGDTVARLGGDEFAVLLDGISGTDEAVAVANRICTVLEQPFELEGTQIFSSVSIGIALGDERYQRAENMLRDADAAMYRAKAKGRQQFVIFDESMHQHAVSLLNLESDLRRAFEKNEFQVAFQPIVCLKTGKIVAFEALVRWYHASKGLIMPRNFIPLAEETGLIMRLDWCVFELACKQLQTWCEDLPDLGHLKLSVNLSSKHFANAGILNRVTQILEKTKVAPNQLKIEITETVLMGNLPAVKTTLEGLQNLGIEIMLDDFGTGYSSLSYLHRFPVDSLKIDRSFVSKLDQNQECRVIVRSIGGLAEGLNISVVAEGIETEDQFNQLRDWGCEYGQGYWISPALAVTDATAFLRHGGLLAVQGAKKST